jgi:hypothetical protein
MSSLRSEQARGGPPRGRAFEGAGQELVRGVTQRLWLDAFALSSVHLLTGRFCRFLAKRPAGG